MIRDNREGKKRIDIDEIEFGYIPAPHISEQDDWHTIYIEKIDALLDWDESDCNAIPEYPPLTDARLDSFELKYSCKGISNWMANFLLFPQILILMSAGLSCGSVFTLTPNI